jgi:hypothetical protein
MTPRPLVDDAGNWASGHFTAISLPLPFKAGNSYSRKGRGEGLHLRLSPRERPPAGG